MKAMSRKEKVTLSDSLPFGNKVIERSTLNPNTIPFTEDKNLATIPVPVRH